MLLKISDIFLGTLCWFQSFEESTSNLCSGRIGRDSVVKNLVSCFRVVSSYCEEMVWLTLLAYGLYKTLQQESSIADSMGKPKGAKANTKQGEKGSGLEMLQDEVLPGSETEEVNPKVVEAENRAEAVEKVEFRTLV